MARRNSRLRAAIARSSAGAKPSGSAASISLIKLRLAAGGSLQLGKLLLQLFQAAAERCQLSSAAARCSGRGRGPIRGSRVIGLAFLPSAQGWRSGREVSRDPIPDSRRQGPGCLRCFKPDLAEAVECLSQQRIAGGRAELALEEVEITLCQFLKFVGLGHALLYPWVKGREQEGAPAGEVH